MNYVAEDRQSVDEFSDQQCPYCLDWHSIAGDGPYPVAHCSIDA